MNSVEPTNPSFFPYFKEFAPVVIASLANMMFSYPMTARSIDNSLAAPTPSAKPKSFPAHSNSHFSTCNNAKINNLIKKFYLGATTYYFGSYLPIVTCEAFLINRSENLLGGKLSAAIFTGMLTGCLVAPIYTRVVRKRTNLSLANTPWKALKQTRGIPMNSISSGIYCGVLLGNLHEVVQHKLMTISSKYFCNQQGEPSLLTIAIAYSINIAAISTSHIPSVIATNQQAHKTNGRISAYATLQQLRAAGKASGKSTLHMLYRGAGWHIAALSTSAVVFPTVKNTAENYLQPKLS